MTLITLYELNIKQRHTKRIIQTQIIFEHCLNAIKTGFKYHLKILVVRIIYKISVYCISISP